MSASFRPFGMVYSASLNEIPRSVGAIRKTFGRCSRSTRPFPPSYVMQIGTFALFATSHDASTPVPSSTIATAPSAIARRTLLSALRGDSALSYRFTFSV